MINKVIYYIVLTENKKLKTNNMYLIELMLQESILLRYLKLTIPQRDL